MRKSLTENPNAKQSGENSLGTAQSERTLRKTRNTAAKWVAAFVLGLVILALSYASHSQFLMPGPLSAVHRLQTKCISCHASVPETRFGWLHTLVAASNPKKESRACLTCHKITPQTTSSHDLALVELEKLTERFKNKSKLSSPPLATRIANIISPVRHNSGNGMFCATCHLEHQGKSSNLKHMTNTRCQSCHIEQFKSFTTGHPEFENYPHKRRTRVIFDHASHFKKHFPEALKENAETQSVPNVCTDCHSTSGDKRLISVKPFKKVCSKCHLDQIVGTGRASGPKGIAFLTLPGLDVATLEEKGISIGEWPTDSEAELTPFLMMLIGLDDQRKKMLQTVATLDLLDLSEASDSELSAVEAFVWELKALLHELSRSKTSKVAKRLAQATGASIDTELAAMLLATIPRDVLLSAQREWLPKLDKEIFSRPAIEKPISKTSILPGDNSLQVPSIPPPQKKEQQQDIEHIPKVPSPSPVSPAYRAQQRSNLLPAGQKAFHSSPPKNIRHQRSIQIAQAENTKNDRRWRIDPFGELIRGGQKNEIAHETSVAQEDGSEPVPDQKPTLVIDAESWAEFGGWYRRDYAILYKPIGHADRFLRTWLDFSGRLRGAQEHDPASSVFDLLTHKDAQGQCNKCHSIDNGEKNVQLIEWGSSTLKTKSSRLTSFKHEPHFSLLDKRGCISCHEINAKAEYQSSYKQRDPKVFDSNFKPMNKQQCTVCHKASAARQDCILCHAYHANEVTSPIAKTNVPKK